VSGAVNRFILAAAFLLLPSLASAQGVKRDDFFLKPLPSGAVGAVSGLETVCPGAGLLTTAANVSGNVATLTMASNPPDSWLRERANDSGIELHRQRHLF